jgi:hypothetical protein
MLSEVMGLVPGLGEGEKRFEAPRFRLIGSNIFPGGWEEITRALDYHPRRFLLFLPLAAADLVWERVLRLASVEPPF